MKPPIVEYEAPRTIAEAVDLLDEYGDEAKILAGGQSLMPLLNMRFAYPTVLIDINTIDGLAAIEREDNSLVIGATARQRTAEQSTIVRSDVPLLAAALPHVGHFVTRNRGTVGGSIVHADPRGEVPLALAVLGGQAVVTSAKGTRTIDASDLFRTHYTTSISDDELLVETRWPVADGTWGYSFQEFSQRHGDYALGMVACAVQVEGGAVANASIAVGAVADRPVVLGDVAGALVGSPIDDDVAATAGRSVAERVSPSSDMHASDRYRRHLAALLTRRALLAAWVDAGGEQP